jgi:ribonuclease HI
MKPVKKKYYVVWKGRKTGLFHSWEACAAAVQGFQGAQYLSFESLTVAQTALGGRYEDYQGKPQQRTKDVVGRDHPIQDSYCVDAACSGNPGVVEYRCVYTPTRKEVFHGGPFQNGTNNIGEFLAIVHALSYLKKMNSQTPIYSDSRIALGWVGHKKCRTKLLHNAENDPLFDWITRAECWLAENTYSTPILHWQTGIWGEIPADFGRK